MRKFGESAAGLASAYSSCRTDAAKHLIKAYEDANGFEDEATVLRVYRELEAKYTSCGATAAKEEKDFADAQKNFRAAVDQAVARAKRQWIVNASYNFVRQYPVVSTVSTTPAPAASGIAVAAPVVAAPAISLPSLSSIGMSWRSGEMKRLKYSGSAFFTAFNNTLPSMTGTGSGLRDWRLTNELEFLLVNNAGSFANGLTFALSGIYLDLRREPLGQKVTISGKEIGTPGKMGVVQGKFTFPAGDSGARIPFSVSWASRTELIPDKEWKFGLGLTFDWKQLLPGN